MKRMDGRRRLPAYDDSRPLFLATERPNLAIMRLLLQAQAVVDGLGAGGGTPLQIASEEGNLECARLLIEWGADVNAAIDLKVDVNNGGFTPLTSACGSGHSDVVRLLLDARADPDKASLKDRFVTKENGRDVDNKVWMKPLYSACKHGDPECVKLILAAGVSQHTIERALAPTQHDMNVGSGCSEACSELLWQSLEDLDDEDEYLPPIEVDAQEAAARAEAERMAAARAKNNPPSDTFTDPLYIPTIDTLRATFTGWVDVHDRAFVTKRDQKAVKEAAIRKAAKKEQRKLAIAIKYAETDAARAAMEGQSTAESSNKDYDDLLRHPPMSEEKRERDAQRRERARKAREERAAAAEMAESKAKAAAARSAMATAAPALQPTPSGPRKEAELVHTSFVSEQERQARAAAGAQKQLDEAAAAAKKRAQKKAKAARQKERAMGAAQAEREQEMPAAPTLGAYIDLSGLG